MSEIIPPEAKKVFSWVRVDVYQWQQQLYDGSVTTFERTRFRDGAFVIAVLPDGQLLMTKQEQPARSKPFLSLPWWWFDTPDEGPLACAQRELLEETGYKSDEWQLWHRTEGTANIIAYTYFFIARNCRKVDAHHERDHGEKITVFSLSFDAFLDTCLDETFVHWVLIPPICRAKISPSEYVDLRQKFIGNL